MTDDQRRRLRRSGLGGLVTLAGVYAVVIAIDRGRDVLVFSVVYAALVAWPAWRYVAAPLVDSARGRAGMLTGPVHFATTTRRGDARFVYVGAERLRLATPAQTETLVAGRSYLVRYAPITRVVLDLQAVASADGDAPGPGLGDHPPGPGRGEEHSS
jgi:hypothetical protein